MQNNRLILWSSFVALTLCAVPYGCAGKSISSGDAKPRQEGTNSVTDGAYPGGDGSGRGDAANQRADGVSYVTDGYRDRHDGIQTPHGDGIQGDGYDPVYWDGAPDYADGASNYADGWDDQSEGQAPADSDGNPDGWPNQDYTNDGPDWLDHAR